MAGFTGTVDDIVKVYEGYVEALLWSEMCRGTMQHEHVSETPEECDRPLDDDLTRDNLANETLMAILVDVINFCHNSWIDVMGLEPEQIGHDFLLTRNHHGAGFWDRGLGERGQRLTESAHAYGDTNAYVGDDGKVYVQ